jgi:hypothetical protein
MSKEALLIIIKHWKKISISYVNNLLLSATPRTTENIIQILANLQDFLRKPIIKNKLSDFYNLKKDEQLEIIRLILNSIPTVNINLLEDLMITWFQVLSEFENVKTNYILGIYLEEISKRPELILKLIRPVIRTIKRLEENNKEILRVCFIETLFNVSNRDTIVQILDKQANDFLNLKMNI